TGMYKNILLVGAEMHSMGLDYSDEGRAVTVIFGDGAGAVILQPTEKEGQGILTTHLHADGTHAEELAMINPGSHGGYHLGTEKFGYPDPSVPGGFVQRALKLPDEKVVNNIQKYGNTTAASIPLAMCEAWEQGRIKEGDLVCLAAFGSGFTWGSALIR
ncbi:unnamed protein product, partial [Darwinula stevensoni]